MINYKNIYEIIKQIKERIGERMKIDEKLVKEIGSVMKLEFTAAEVDSFVEKINQTVGMLENLETLDLEDVEGTFYGRVDSELRFRKDEAIKNDEVDLLIENAPRSKDQLIQVPAILEDGEGGA